MITKLPQGLPLQQMANTWATALNPVLACPIFNGLLLENIELVSGSNSVNHKLNRKLIGWMLTRINAPAVIYDTQETNQMPQLTLTLESDADTRVSLWVF